MSETDFLKVGEIAKKCRVCPMTVRRWIDKGLLKGFVVPGGTHRRVRRDDLIVFMREHRMAS